MMDLKQEDIKKLPCGVLGATYIDTLIYMDEPLIHKIIATFPDNHDDFIWDVKVHMLMPGLWPCLPAWHCDFVPRPDGAEDFSLIDDSKYMYLWLSGTPLAEFIDERIVTSQSWIKFNQRDLHRGAVSDEFTWRIFIRAAHKEIAHVINHGESCIRRHSQAYVDVNNFRW